MSAGAVEGVAWAKPVAAKPLLTSVKSLCNNQVMSKPHTPTTLTLSKPRDEANAKSFPSVVDRSTIFGGYRDDLAMASIETALKFVGDEVGHMVTSTEVAFGTGLGQHGALSTLAVLTSWNFVANLGTNSAGRYVYARTTRPTRDLDRARHEAWLRVMVARDQAARKQVAA